MKNAFINGKIYTSDSKNEFCDTFIVNNGIFEEVGNYVDLQDKLKDCSTIFDLENQFVLAGFIDSHVHFIPGGFSLINVNMSEVRSKEEFIDYIKKYKNKKTIEWIQGGNWDHELFFNKELPNRHWIDDLTSDVPLFLTRTDYHMGLANSKALEFANINESTIDPVGGQIDRDGNGKLTGILRDKAMNLVIDKIKRPSSIDYKNAIKKALEYAAENGVTSVHDVFINENALAFDELQTYKNLTCRINIAQTLKLVEEYKKIGIKNNFGNDKIKIGSLKAFVDGSLGSSTAWFLEEYYDMKNYFGLPMKEILNGELREMMIKADFNQNQLVIHALGDRAVKETIDIFEEINRVNPKWDRRHRIEHAQHIKLNDIKRMAQLGVIASVQPQHLFDDGSWMISKIGEQRINEVFPFKTMIDNGVKICFGSDWTVSPMKPLLGIYTAVTRHIRENDNNYSFNPKEIINVKKAINAYTIDAAFAMYNEDKLGSIEKGKYADFIILNKNLFEIESSEIKNVKILETYFDGNRIYG